MSEPASTTMPFALAWVAAILGSVETLSDHSKEHADHASTITRLRTPAGRCYLKVHDDAAAWHNEVHGYEHWARAFGGRAPRLLAVRDEPPLALIISELPGRILERTKLAPAQERAVWRVAGAALVALHELEVGPGFGACMRDGTPVPSAVISHAPVNRGADTGERGADTGSNDDWCGAAPDLLGPVSPPCPAWATDAVAHVAWRFGHEIERAVDGGYIDDAELATLRKAYDLIPAFEGEQPTPCHRDYCAPNLLVDDAGAWSGVIDFEFARWDVRVADFTRDPNWAYVVRPDLYAAFLEGYARPFSPQEEQQLLVAHAEYALGAILWGHDGAFYGFEREGREALVHLAELL